jgi:hypothetical protein
MKKSSCIFYALVSLGLIAATALAPAANAQDESTPVTAQVSYIQVQPDRVGDYLSIEREFWKPLQQERVDDGDILSWQLYEVRIPTGTAQDYQYVVITLYDDLDVVANPDFEKYVERVHPDRDANAAVRRTNEVRQWQRNELWFQRDRVVPQTPSSEPAPFMMVDYVNTPPGGEGDYIRFEQDVWKPIHQARIDAGAMSGWSLWQMGIPDGTSQSYNHRTVRAYRRMSEIPGSFPPEVFEEVHPDRTIDEILQETRAQRELAQRELWELIDHVGPAPLVTSER